MRLTVPEPKIRLYEQGFEDIGEDGQKLDKLGRKQTGDKLSDLVERIDDPLVIALDGAWGSGKSFFLKCWVGEHLKREGNTTQTVYFDAFQHDFLDDPLIALTGAIAERFEDPKDEDQDLKTERSKKMKKAAWAVGRGVLRIGASVATFGATEALSDMGDAVAKAVGDEAKTVINSSAGEAEAEKFWNAHDTRIAAMEAFRLALTELTEPNEQGDPQRKLVIVIDELDRCRPDYALSLLEIIKHFFNVDGVHFVLGVNLKALQNSVLARYGSGVDAKQYLQKFITMNFMLSDLDGTPSPKPIWKEYFFKAAHSMEFPDGCGALFQASVMSLDSLNIEREVSLRDVQKVLTVLATSHDPHASRDYGYTVILSGMAVLKALTPDLYRDFRFEELNINKLETAFNFALGEDGHLKQQAETVWRYVIATRKEHDPDPKELHGAFGMFGLRYNEHFVREFTDHHLEAFQLTTFKV